MICLRYERKCLHGPEVANVWYTGSLSLNSAIYEREKRKTFLQLPFLCHAFEAVGGPVSFFRPIVVSFPSNIKKEKPGNVR